MNSPELFICTKCGKLKAAHEMASDLRKTNKMHSWCKECKNESTKAREQRERDEYGTRSQVRRKRATRPTWKPTELYKATPRKPQSEWTEKERARWRKVLLDPKRRAKVKMMMENRT
jgi:hypothetical protein